jgi:trans-2,3-dihydro-3-hydroxyanthranilate isomerase
VVSTGAGHLLIEAVSRDAVDRATPDSARLLAVLREAGGEGAYVYCLDPLRPQAGAVAYARFFNPTVGIAEDPATGTAAGPLMAALLAPGRRARRRFGRYRAGLPVGRQCAGLQAGGEGGQAPAGLDGVVLLPGGLA